ncbi:MAG TPA: hypothetical protein VLA17_02130, partial [Candidatus Limnocylindria bacterium]|nr:hypothetical protein [Candidatus Limnocylindria bacterium]
HGGQFIFIVPALKLVVATTALSTPGEGRREHQRAIYDLMDGYLVPAAERSRSAGVRSPSKSRSETLMSFID